MDRRVEAFLAAARAALPEERIERPVIRTFGNSEEMARTLIELIASGQKTGTFALEAEYASRPEERPRTGQHVVVTDFAGEPVLLYRITEAEVVPFEGIAERHLQVEGPRLREVSAWRAIHRAYWAPVLRRRGQEIAADTPIIFHRFEVLHPRPATRP